MLDANDEMFHSVNLATQLYNSGVLFYVSSGVQVYLVHIHMTAHHSTVLMCLATEI